MNDKWLWGLCKKSPYHFHTDRYDSYRFINLNIPLSAPHQGDKTQQNVSLKIQTQYVVFLLYKDQIF